MANVNRLRKGSRVGEKKDNKSTGTVVDIINSQNVYVYWDYIDHTTDGISNVYGLSDVHPSDLKLFRRKRKKKEVKDTSFVLLDDSKCYGSIPGGCSLKELADRVVKFPGNRVKIVNYIHSGRGYKDPTDLMFEYDIDFSCLTQREFNFIYSPEGARALMDAAK